MNNQKNKFNLIGVAVFVFFVLFSINPIFGIIFIVIAVLLFKNNKNTSHFFTNYLQTIAKSSNVSSPIILQNLVKSEEENISLDENNLIKYIPTNILTQSRLEKRKKYLHIALNNSLEEAENIIQQLPPSDRILIEVGTPMIKRYGIDAINQIKNMTPAGTYIVADNKCADLASREVEMMANAGANASTCLGVAPIETIDSFIDECKKYKIDSMLDMMNVEDSLSVLKKLKKLPDVVMLHRGVDETETSNGKRIPLYQIKQIKGNYNIIVSVAGGDTIKEIQSALFNDADIVVVWKNFYQATSDTAQLAESFLKEIK